MTQTKKTILITGANRGIGLALSEVSLKQGWNVIATIRNSSSAAALTSLGERFLGQLRVEVMDVTKDQSVSAIAEKLGSTPIDILVNNAGVIGPEKQSSREMDFAGFADTLAANTIAPLRVAQAFLPSLESAAREAGIAKIATITSAMGSLADTSPDHLAYRASKAAVNKLMQGLATDMKASKIAVFLLHPGWVRTDMGGEGADIDATTSATGIFNEVSKRGLTETGSFFNYAGDAIRW